MSPLRRRNLSLSCNYVPLIHRAELKPGNDTCNNYTGPVRSAQNSQRGERSEPALYSLHAAYLPTNHRQRGNSSALGKDESFPAWLTRFPRHTTGRAAGSRGVGGFAFVNRAWFPPFINSPSLGWKGERWELAHGSAVVPGCCWLVVVKAVAKWRHCQIGVIL